MQYYIIYKPYQVLSQFSAEGNKRTLKDIVDVPQDVYPVGRLDYDSEGLLLLTNDAAINQALLHPAHAHEREYWVQVEGTITTPALHELQMGIDIQLDGKTYRTKPCTAVAFAQPPIVPARTPPIRFRKNVPDSWVRLVLTEGKNRQVRRMTAAIGFPTLRLIRYRIGKLTIDGLQPGDIKAISRNQIGNRANK